MLKKIWHDPVWSKVISALILSVCGVIWAAIHFAWWSVVSKVARSAVQRAFAFLVATSPIPHWLVGLVGLIVLLVVVTIVSATVGARTEAKTAYAGIIAPPGWLSYTTDTFYKVRWRWTYGPGREMTIPVCFCPRCDCQLVAHDRSRVPGMDMTAFHCPACDRSINEVEKSLDYIEQTVALFIQKNIRNDTWVRRENPAGSEEASDRRV